MDNVPAFGHHLTERVEYSGPTGSPVAPVAPVAAAQRVMGHLDPDAGDVSSRRSVVAAVMPSARSRRRGPDPTIVAGFVDGAIPRETLNASQPDDGVNKTQQKLARARNLLSAKPFLLDEMKAHVAARFADMFGPETRINLNIGTVSPWRAAAWLFRLRSEVLGAADAAHAMVALCDADSAIGSLREFNPRHAAQQATNDAAVSVALIGEILGLTGLPPNADLSADFFDVLSGDTAATDTGRA